MVHGEGWMLASDVKKRGADEESRRGKRAGEVDPVHTDVPAEAGNVTNKSVICRCVTLWFPKSLGPRVAERPRVVSKAGRQLFASGLVYSRRSQFFTGSSRRLLFRFTFIARCAGTTPARKACGSRHLFAHATGRSTVLGRERPAAGRVSLASVTELPTVASMG
jgi:hypothetical protein